MENNPSIQKQSWDRIVNNLTRWLFHGWIIITGLDRNVHFYVYRRKQKPIEAVGRGTFVRKPALGKVSAMSDDTTYGDYEIHF